MNYSQSDSRHTFFGTTPDHDGGAVDRPWIDAPDRIEMAEERQRWRCAPESGAPTVHDVAPIRVALIGDQLLIIEGLKELLQKVPCVAPTYVGPLLEESLWQLADRGADVAIIDGIGDTMRAVRFARRVAKISSGTRLLLLSMRHTRPLLDLVVCGAVHGVLVTDTLASNLGSIVGSLVDGEPAIPQLESSVTQAMRDPGPRTAALVLTCNEKRILRMAAAGYGNKDIGKALGRAEGTIKNSMSLLLAKLDARDRTHAVLRAISAGLL